MKDSARQKILIGVDGSDRAFEAVRYISKIPSFRGRQVTLFHVFSKIPESYWDLEKRSVELGWKIRDVRVWEVQREKEIREYMEKARQLLIGAGFPQDSVKVKIQERDKGIGRLGHKLKKGVKNDTITLKTIRPVVSYTPCRAPSSSLRDPPYRGDSLLILVPLSYPRAFACRIRTP